MGAAEPSALEAPKPPVWPAFVTFIAALGANTAAALPFLIVLAVQLLSAKENPAQLADLGRMAGRFPVTVMLMLVASVLSTAAVAAIALWLLRTTAPVPVLERSRVPLPAALVVLALLASLSMGSVSTWLALHTGHMQTSTLKMFSTLCTTLPLWAFIVMAFFGSVVPGIAEEAIFRGVVQRHFTARWDPVSGVLLSSLLFGLMHFDLMQGSFAFCIGLLMGTLAHRAGTLWPGMAAHALNNLASFIGSRFAPDPAHALPPSELAVPAAVLASSLAAIAWLLRRGRAGAPA